MTDASDLPAREAMDYDVVIVGAGPAGLSAAIRLKQLAAAAGTEVSLAVLEKGSEVGAHILSGAVIDPKALNELFPDWRAMGAPLDTPVTEDRYLVLGAGGELDISWVPKPPFMTNHGMYIVSLANVCRWLAEQAEALTPGQRPPTWSCHPPPVESICSILSTMWFRLGRSWRCALTQRATAASTVAARMLLEPRPEPCGTRLQVSTSSECPSS